jgi:hypothetical protein
MNVIYYLIRPLKSKLLLVGDFKSGKLMWTKPQEAYFLKMATETMTATDIANNKMILQAGLAGLLFQKIFSIILPGNLTP